ncbi:MAG: sensor histidine kinase [Acidimicrobiia bacterium]
MGEGKRVRTRSKFSVHAPGAGFIELLNGDPSHEPGLDEKLLRLAQREAFDLTYLVEDLLVFGRGDDGDLVVDEIPVDLRVELARVLEPIDRPKGTTVETIGDAVACGDPTRIRQVIRNLLTNAFRYGGSRITVAPGRHDVMVRLVVCDDGEGIPSEYVNKIFEPYHQAHAAPTLPGSVGLGLAASLRLARRMGGDLVYERRDDETVFALTLPVPSPTALEPPLVTSIER